MKRRPTVEMRNIIKSQGLLENLPPAPGGGSLREWFAGLALSNPALMEGVSRRACVSEVIRIADELVAALAVPRQPSQESMRPPSPAELQAWTEANARTRATVPEFRSPPPPRVTLPDAPRPRRRSSTTAVTAPAPFVMEHRNSIPPPAATTKPPAAAGRYSGTVKDD